MFKLDQFQCINGIKEANLLASNWQVNLSQQENLTKLSSKEQDCHYQSICTWVNNSPENQAFKRLDRSALSELNVPIIYDGDVLFHQNKLKVIDSIIGYSDDGILGCVKASSNLSPTNQWVAILDGGLQLAVLWIWKKTNQGSLPLRIESMSVYDSQESDWDEEIEVEIRESQLSTNKATVDIRYITASGKILCEIIGLDFISHFNKTFPNLPGGVNSHSQQDPA